MPILDANAVSAIFYPYASREEERLERNGTKLSHYTSAENAMRILDSQSFFLRQASLMNDHREIQHGTECIVAALQSLEGQRLRALLVPHHPGALPSAIQFLDKVMTRARADVFISSLCAHDADDTTGVLSMWRAYGGPVVGACIVFDTDAISAEEVDVGVFSSPVLYAHPAQFGSFFREFVDSIESNIHVLANLPLAEVSENIGNALQFAALCTKDPSFREESEWRLLHLPNEVQNSQIICDSLTIRGIPQLVYKIPLQSSQPEWPLSFDKLIHRIIVGPSAFDERFVQAFIYRLHTLGVSNPRSKVCVSGIPLRQ